MSTTELNECHDECHDVCCEGDDSCACGGTMVHVGFGPMCDTCGCSAGTECECEEES